MTDYKVVAECAHVVVDGGIRLIYKGAPVPDGQDPKRLAHLLSSKLIASVDEVTVAPNAAVVPDGYATTGGERVRPEQPPAAPDEGSEVEQRRAAAKAKLPTDGSAPHPNAGHDVWVEFAVKQGLDRTESEKASKDDLKKALQK